MRVVAVLSLHMPFCMQEKKTTDLHQHKQILIFSFFNAPHMNNSLHKAEARHLVTFPPWTAENSREIHHLNNADP